MERRNEGWKGGMRDGSEEIEYKSGMRDGSQMKMSNNN